MKNRKPLLRNSHNPICKVARFSFDNSKERLSNNRSAYNKINEMRCSEQFHTTKQKVNQIAMENTVVIVEFVGNVHSDNDLLEKILCQQQ